MGIDLFVGTSMRPMQPKAIVQRTLSNEVIAKANKLFETYDEIPFNLFGTLWLDAYGELFDASSLGFDNGLLGFFGQLQTVEIGNTGRGYVARFCNQSENKRLNNNIDQDNISIQQVKSIVQENRNEDDNWKEIIKINRARNNWLFNPESLLWCVKNNTKKLLIRKPSDIIIASSPLEMALARDPVRVQSAIDKINQVMCQFPDGIKLNEICTYIDIDKSLFNTVSINFMVYEYPELFFVVESKIEGTDKLVFSGLTTTDPDYTGQIFKKADYSNGIINLRTITNMIVSGLYQKTLLLIRAAGSKGLKLAVWYQSIRNNFKIRVGSCEENLLNQEPLTNFRCLASFGLVAIESPTNCKNDLRIRLPTKRINFEDFMYEITRKKEAAELKIKEERWSEIRSYSNYSTVTLASQSGSSSPMSSEDKDISE